MEEQERRNERLEEIKRWEKRYFYNEPGDIGTTWQKWCDEAFAKLPERQRIRILEWNDRFLFYAQSLTLHSRYHEEAVDRLLTHARVFNHQIKTIEDMQTLKLEHLHFIHSQQMAKQRLIALGEGGAAGFGGPLLLTADIPAMLLINIRSVQLTALTYGYDLRDPHEMMIALKVFHAAALPKGLQKQAWVDVHDELDSRDETLPYFYNGREEIVDSGWLHQSWRQIGKATLISLLRRKLIQGIPVLGIAIGAAMNYRFAKQVTEIASHFYEKRYLTHHE